MRFRVASWNVELGSGGQATEKLGLIEQLDCDLVLLQEVMPGGCDLLERRTGFEHVFHSRTLRPHAADEGTSRARHCAILAGSRFSVVTGATLLPEAPATERTLTVGLRLDDKAQVDAGSFHFVAGSDAKWGRAAKGLNFRVVTDWMARFPATGVAGIDANSPKLDHPDLVRNVYFGGEIQREYILHDRARAAHELRDSLRTWLDGNPDKMEEIRRSRPDGPLAVSHINRGNPRRFDFVFLAALFDPTNVSYEYEAARNVGANHAPVIVDVEVRPAS
jgi:hypothetical protein